MKFQIQDTCGEETYHSLVQGFYRNTSLAILVYDVNNKKTFDSLDYWIKDLRQQTEENIPIFMVGNNIDLEKKVQTEEALAFSVSNRIKYFTECSARTGTKVKEIFYEAAKYLYRTYKDFQSQKKLTTSSTIKIAFDDKKKSGKKKKNNC